MALSEAVPAGAVERLTEHFGATASVWLAWAGRLVADAAHAWGVRLSGFHDAGWTSVIGVGVDAQGQAVTLKATPDRSRFVRERSALTHWQGSGVVELLHTDDTRQVLLLRAVGQVAGGRPRPESHEQRVASVLSQLHVKAADYIEDVPSLSGYYQTEVRPRTERRAKCLEQPIPRQTIDAALALCDELSSGPRGSSLLHGDLYAENVLFDESGAPVFIDPLAMTGDAAFDWAFWTVYYIPLDGFERRLALCEAYAPCPIERILQWIATLVVDGALFYIETDDARAAEMLRILSTDLVRDVLQIV